MTSLPSNLVATSQELLVEAIKQLRSSDENQNKITIETVPKNKLKRVYFQFRSLSDRPVCEVSLSRL
jgi:hypothetical protein